MSFESPIALKRLATHIATTNEKQFAFTPLVWSDSPQETSEMYAAIGPALAQTYLDTNFNSLTMGAPMRVWVNEDLLEDLSVLAQLPRLVGVLISSALLEHPDWDRYALALANAGLDIVAIERAALADHTADSSNISWVSVSAREPHIISVIAEMRSRGFKVVVTDAPRSFFEGDVDFGDAYLGPVHFSRAKNRQPLAPGEAQCIEAIRILGEPDADLAEVSAVLSLDPEMVIRVLHMANSAAVGAMQRIDSLTHAIVYLGSQRISQLVMQSMISFRIPDTQTMWFVLTRAAVCRALAHGTEIAYTAGLLSALAEDVGESPETMAMRAGVSFEVSLAMSAGAGDLGALVEAVRAYERGDVDTIVRYGWDPIVIAETYFEALPNTFEYMKLLYGEAVLAR